MTGILTDLKVKRRLFFSKGLFICLSLIRFMAMLFFYRFYFKRINSLQIILLIGLNFILFNPTSNFCFNNYIHFHFISIQIHLTGSSFLKQSIMKNAFKEDSDRYRVTKTTMTSTSIQPSVVVYQYLCVKESGMSINQPSDLPKKFK